MDDQLKSLIDSLDQNACYLLMPWKEALELVNYDWVETECLVYVDSRQPQPRKVSLFVPVRRLAETRQPR